MSEAATGGQPPGERTAGGLIDLASRALGGSVLYANDELFAAKENLITPGPPEFSPDAFGPRGKIYDGWETRRRREPGHDNVIVRLGCPGIVHQVVVDTAYFRGNYPPEISVEAVRADGYPSPAELAALTWTTLVPRAPALGDSQNPYQVTDRLATRHKLTPYAGTRLSGAVRRVWLRGRPIDQDRPAGRLLAAR